MDELRLPKFWGRMTIFLRGSETGNAPAIM